MSRQWFKEIMAIMSYRIFEYVYLNVRAYLHAVGESEIMNETQILVTEYLPVSATLHFCHVFYYHDHFEQNLYRACDTNLSIPFFRGTIPASPTAQWPAYIASQIRGNLSELRQASEEHGRPLLPSTLRPEVANFLVKDGWQVFSFCMGSR